MALYVNSPVVSTGGGTSGWTRINVTANQQDVDITFAGETGYCIEVRGVLTNNNAALSTYTIQPNAVSTSQVAQDVEGAGVSAGAFASSALTFGFAGASGGKCSFHFWFTTKTGDVRDFDGSYCNLSSVLAISNNAQVNGVWTDTSTTITSVRLHSNRSDGFKANACYVLYRSVPLAS